MTTAGLGACLRGEASPSSDEAETNDSSQENQAHDSDLLLHTCTLAVT